MREHLLYQRLKQIAFDNSYTAEQVRSVTKRQVAGLLSQDVDAVFWSDGNEGFFENLKLNLAQEIEQTNNQADLDFLKEQLNVTAVKKRFTDCQYEFREIDGKRCVLIWLDGKSEVTE